MMYCKKCGKEVQSDWTNCAYCGENLKENNTETSSTTKESVLKKKPFYKKKRFWLILIVILCLSWLCFGDGTETDKDITQMDMDEFIGKSEDFVNEYGFKSDDEYTLAYGILDGAVQIDCNDEKVSTILIQKKTEEDIPSFHGVKIDMDVNEAYDILSGFYSEKFNTGKDTGKEYEKTFIDLDNKNYTTIQGEDNKVKIIKYSVMSDEDIAKFKLLIEFSYIFPNSNSEYLSEDDVRAIDNINTLTIGRNEIYARHGYIFENIILKQYFENTTWYNGTIPADKFNADSVFNDFEKKNIELIKQIEDEMSGPSEEELEQEAIENAVNAVAGNTYHLQDAQFTVTFTSDGTFIYSISSFADASCPYTFTSRYENYKDDQWDYLVYVTIADTEYYFRYFNDGTINLSSTSGSGEFDGWYEPL